MYRWCGWRSAWRWRPSWPPTCASASTPASLLHPKMAMVDGERLLVGSFNLYPFSMANLEVLVVTDDHAAASAAEPWLAAQLHAGRLDRHRARSEPPRARHRCATDLAAPPATHRR